VTRARLTRPGQASRSRQSRITDEPDDSESEAHRKAGFTVNSLTSRTAASMFIEDPHQRTPAHHIFVALLPYGRYMPVFGAPAKREQGQPAEDFLSFG
jgi:hypothetical protein